MQQRNAFESAKLLWISYLNGPLSWQFLNSTNTEEEDLVAVTGALWPPLLPALLKKQAAVDYCHPMPLWAPLSTLMNSPRKSISITFAAIETSRRGKNLDNY